VDFGHLALAALLGLLLVRSYQVSKQFYNRGYVDGCGAAYAILLGVLQDTDALGVEEKKLLLNDVVATCTSEKRLRGVVDKMKDSGEHADVHLPQ